MVVQRLVECDCFRRSGDSNWSHGAPSLVNVRIDPSYQLVIDVIVSLYRFSILILSKIPKSMATCFLLAKPNVRRNICILYDTLCNITGSIPHAEVQFAHMP